MGVKISKANTEYFADPEARKKQSEIIKNSESARVALQINHEKMKNTLLVTRETFTERIPAASLNSYTQDGWKHRTTHKGTQMFINKEGNLKRIPKEELDRFLTDGWVEDLCGENGENFAEETWFSFK